MSYYCVQVFYVNCYDANYFYHLHFVASERAVLLQPCENLRYAHSLLFVVKGAPLIQLLFPAE